MEPFRPLVDVTVKALCDSGEAEVTSCAKQFLARLMTFDLETERGVSPIFVCLQRMATSLAQAFEAGKPEINLPKPPTPEQIQALYKAITDSEL